MHFYNVNEINPAASLRFAFFLLITEKEGRKAPVRMAHLNSDELFFMHFNLTVVVCACFADPFNCEEETLMVHFQHKSVLSQPNPNYK